MKKLTRQEADAIVNVMLASPENDRGTGSVDLADALDMLDAKRQRASRAFYRAMQQLVDERRVVQTQPTPYARWKAVRQTRDPQVTDVRGRRRGMLSRADYITQVQVGLGRALTKSERNEALRSRLDHIVPSLVVRAFSPGAPTPVAETYATEGEDPIFVVTIDIEEASSEAVIIRAITRSVAISRTIAWLKSIDFDNLDGVKFTAREYEAVHVVR